MGALKLWITDQLGSGHICRSLGNYARRCKSRREEIGGPEGRLSNRKKLYSKRQGTLDSSEHKVGHSDGFDAGMGALKLWLTEQLGCGHICRSLGNYARRWLYPQARL
jgi:hypothetical protein